MDENLPKLCMIRLLQLGALLTEASPCALTPPTLLEDSWRLGELLAAYFIWSKCWVWYVVREKRIRIWNSGF